MEPVERAAALVGVTAPKMGPSNGKHPDPLAAVCSFRARQQADLPPRVWYWDGGITPGFNLLTARKAMGKSYFLMQMADCIAAGAPFLGRNTRKAKVLYVAFELDELDTSERFKAMLPLSENAHLVHSWPTEEAGLELAERAIVECGYNVLVFDTFLPLLPPASAFEINGYGDSTLYLKWRLLGKRHGAAIVASWHEGKSPRDDYMLNAIGSTGMVGQADCIISIDRKRGDTAGKLWIGGNHAAESAIPFTFENGIFALAEGPAAVDRLTPDEEKTVIALQGHPEGASTAAVALAMGKSEEAARKSINRLVARGKALRVRRGLYCLSNGQTDNSGQFPFSHEGNRTGTDTPLEGVSVTDPLSGPDEEVPEPEWGPGGDR